MIAEEAAKDTSCLSSVEHRRRRHHHHHHRKRRLVWDDVGDDINPMINPIRFYENFSSF